MNWYKSILPDLENKTPIYSVCGDDCAVCPRYLARTEEELHQTAVFWHKVGWRDRVVSNEEIRCNGCGSRERCAFAILPCLKERNLERCKACDDYPCDKINRMHEGSAAKEALCRAACGDEAVFRMLSRAFYEKEKNLNR